MAKVNYLLGRAEKLVRKLEPPKIKPSKAHPYSFDRAVERVAPKIESTAKALAKLPDEACPADEAVALVTLHPSYLAKSYFPDSLLDEANLRPVGSRPAIVKPEAWAVKNPPDTATTAEIFVAGKRADFERLPSIIRQLSAGDPSAIDVQKIEDVRVYPVRERVRTPQPKSQMPFWEVILHATGLPQSDYILEAFRDYLKGLDITVDLDARLHAQGLCFLPIRIPKQQIVQVAQFSFLRAAREMPRMRPVARSASKSPTFSVALPDRDVLDPTIRLVAYDGGLPKSPDISRWAARKKANGVGAADSTLTDHGLGVTSALLFGPLEDGAPLPQPFAKVEHIRIVDADSEDDDSQEYFDVAKRIIDNLESGRYEFALMCMCPDLPIEDDNVHLWTAMLDQYLKDGTTLTGIAAGNTGEYDHASGAARAQIPADCVNALAFGSADRPGPGWKRSSHSSIGPGRSPGVVKPDVLSFGGSAKNPFYVLGADGRARGTLGTSFATPTGLRMAVGVRAHLGPVLSPLALKALLIHRSDPSTLPQVEVGWGKVAESVAELITSDDSAACIVYQGHLTAGSWMRAPIPTPDGPLSGMVEIAATICFASDTDPQDPIHYTRSGLEIRFRPNDEKKGKADQRDANSKPFFSGASLYDGEQELRADFHKWETTLHSNVRMRGSSLKNPCFDIHYHARKAGGKAGAGPSIPYALIVSVKAPKVKNLYDGIVRRYRTVLEALRPVIEIRVPGA